MTRLLLAYMAWALAQAHASAAALPLPHWNAPDPSVHAPQTQWPAPECAVESSAYAVVAGVAQKFGNDGGVFADALYALRSQLHACLDYYDAPPPGEAGEPVRGLMPLSGNGGGGFAIEARRPR